MGRVFLDTSFLLSFTNKKDEHYDKAREAMKDLLEEEIVISDHVFAETVNIVFSRNSHWKARNFAKYLEKSEIKIINLNKPGFQDTIDIFQEKEMSFTDCSIVAAMNLLDIDKLATFDKEFEKFDGVEVIP